MACTRSHVERTRRAMAMIVSRMVQCGTFAFSLGQWATVSNATRLCTNSKLQTARARAVITHALVSSTMLCARTTMAASIICARTCTAKRFAKRAQSKTTPQPPTPTPTGMPAGVEREELRDRRWQIRARVRVCTATAPRWRVRPQGARCACAGHAKGTTTTASALPHARGGVSGVDPGEAVGVGVAGLEGSALTNCAAWPTLRRHAEGQHHEEPLCAADPVRALVCPPPLAPAILQRGCTLGPAVAATRGGGILRLMWNRERRAPGTGSDREHWHSSCHWLVGALQDCIFDTLTVF